MTQQEFKALVHKNQSVERFFGYIMFLFPIAVALFFLGGMIVLYISDPISSIMIWIAGIIALPCAWWAWWGLRSIKRKFKTFTRITFDANQVTAKELIAEIAERMNCSTRKLESGLLQLRSDGWQTDYIVFMGTHTNQLFADIRITDNDGFFTWGIKKVKKRFGEAVNAVATERQLQLSLEMEAISDFGN